MQPTRTPTAVLASLVALTVGLAGCHSARAPLEPARPPSITEAGLPRCDILPNQLRPLVVEWTGADRGSLELRLRRGVVAVRYEGCRLEILRDCSGPGEYAYAGFTHKRDVVTIESTDELFTQMPVGDSRLAAQLLRVGALQVDMTLVGMYEASRADYRTDELRGQCDGATHVLAGAQVGAFSLYAGARTDATATGAESADVREVLGSDGSMAACAAATTADRAAPEGCGALVRLEFSPLRPAQRPTIAQRADPAPVVGPAVEPPWSEPLPPEPPAPPASARASTIDPVIDEHAQSEHSRSEWAPVDPAKLQHSWSEPAPPRVVPRPRYRALYASGFTIVAGGVAGLVVGIIGMGNAAVLEKERRESGISAARMQDWRDGREQASRYQIAGFAAGISGLAIGVALLIFAAHDHLEHQEVARAPRWRVGPMIGRGHGGLDVKFRF